MSWMIDISGRELSSITWPQRCALCDAADASECVEATGDNVIFTTGGLSVSKVFSCAVPCCKACTGKAKKFTITALSVMLGPWLLILPLSFSKGFNELFNPYALECVMVACFLMMAGIALFWGRVIFTRAVRLYMQGNHITGIVMRHTEFAKETAELNGLELKKVSGFKAW
jgi:hypothetical protein